MKKNKGIVVTYVLVFTAVFLVILSGLLGFTLLQLKQSDQRVAWAEALNIAEAGVNYYRWCLNNNIEANCPSEKDYTDLNETIIGNFSLAITSRTSCGQNVERKITSQGSPAAFPELDRKITVVYARPSVAEHSYFLNDDVWVGSDHEIRGLFSSNGGIRMDGENQSIVSSAKETWACTSSFGCDSCPAGAGCQVQNNNCVCPGVFTTTLNSKPDLFNYPVPAFDFNGITIDLAQMKTASQSSGVYLPPSVTINSQGKGYHLKFKDNGSVEVWLITRVLPTYAYSLEEGWHYDYFTIARESLYNTYTVPADCSVVFAEDNIWPEGIVKGKITVAAANLISPTIDADIILIGDIDYGLKDGSDSLALISERNVLIGPQSPSQMEIRGIFIAQKGRFSRNHYPNNFKEKLEIYGSIVSNGRVGTQWISGSQIVSGYLKRESYYDSKMAYGPPVFVPYTSPEFKITSWEEIR